MNLIAHHPLKAYDSVQLATCLEAKKYVTHQDGLYFVCNDNQLREAARIEGLQVLNPRLDSVPQYE